MKLQKKSNKTLVAVPVPGTFEHISCLEYAISASESGTNVYFMDLSRLSLGLKEFLWWFCVSVTHKNTLSTTIKRIANEFNLNLIRLPRKGFARFQMEINTDYQKEIELTFEKSLKSKFNTIIGHPDFLVDSLSRRIISRERKRFFRAYFGTRSLIQGLGVDRVVTWNGRFVKDAAVALACKHQAIEVNLLEVVSGLRDEFEVYEVSPHSLSNREKLQEVAWQNRSEDSSELARLELKRKFEGRAPEGGDFTKLFRRKFNTSDFTDKPLVAFFPGTSFENAALGYIDSTDSFGGDEAEAFKELTKVAHTLGYATLVRVHPRGNNPSLVAKYEDSKWQKICDELGSFILLSESEIDSYSLLLESHVNVVYQSSIAIESMVLGCPTLILGKTDYSYLVPEICAFSQDVLTAKLSIGAQRVEVERLFPWAYWYAKGGYEVKELIKESGGRTLYRNIELFKPRSTWKLIKTIVNEFAG